MNNSNTLKKSLSALSIAAILGLGSLSAVSAEATSDINPVFQDAMISEKAVQSLNNFQNEIFSQVNKDLNVKVDQYTNQALQMNGYTMDVTITLKLKEEATLATAGL